MLHGTADFDTYWQRVLDEVEALRGSPVVINELPIRNNEVSTAYGATFRGVGDYPLFAYYTVPRGNGPFPALFQAPGYGSVVAVPDYRRRGRYAIMALCHRGQRLSDSGYSAAYPGLLTDGLPHPDQYRWRDIVADCLRAVDVLTARPEADGARLAAAGNDLAAITAGLRPSVRFLLLNGLLLFRDSHAALSQSGAYPRQELNDYARTYPQDVEAAGRTLSLFDPIAFAPRIDAETLVTCSPGERGPTEQLVVALGDKASLTVRSGRGHPDHALEEEWLADRTGA